MICVGWSSFHSPKLLALCCVALCVGGCATWDESEPGSAFELPVPKMSPDSVVLEIAFVRVPPEFAPQLQSLWVGVDEQRFPADLRRILASNGLRTGVAGSQLPTQLQTLLEHDASQPVTPTAGGQLAEDSFLRRRRLPIRSGQPAKIVVVPGMPSRMVVVYAEEGHVRAKDFDLAQGILQLVSFPQGDGRVKLQLTPTIEHGEMRNRYVGGENSFLLKPERETTTFDALRMELMLSPGESLLMTSTDDCKGLGDQFFGAQHHPDGLSSIMLIRLAQTQLDDLFTPQETTAPMPVKLSD